jgi:c-di-GMP-binding flagellar brake protein YcgR
MASPGDTERAQRRDYFRARIGLSLLVPTQRAPREGVPYQPPTGSGADYRILRVRDLSGGGCCCETTDPWPPVGSRWTGYLYLDDARGPLELDLLVLRRQESDDEPVALVAFRFLEMRESKRQRVLRALFREYRRQRRREAEA